MSKVSVSIGVVLISLVLTACSNSGPAKGDIQRVIEGELAGQAALTPGGRMVLKALKGFKADCRQGVTPESSELYACELGGTMVVRGYVNDKPTTPDDKEAPLRGVMSFKKNAAGDWALVSWEGA